MFFKRSRKRKRPARQASPAWVRHHARKFVTFVFAGLGLLAVWAGGAFGWARLESYVNTTAAQRTSPRITLVDLPPEIGELAGPALYDRLEGFFTASWTARSLPEKLASDLSLSGWVEKVHYVRRTGGGEFQISCRYRKPLAMVQHESGFFLVERSGVRLPGTYRYDPAWLLLQGIQQPPPSAGSRWVGEDLQAGLAVADVLLAEPLVGQITAVIVGNFEGRLDRRSSHIELATDRAGGRIRWGSAPGLELEENTVEQKLAILRENYRSTGRVDAEYAVIDVAVFANRFIVPG